MDILEALIGAIANADRKEANRLIEEWGTQYGYNNLIIEALGPALRRVGELWQKEEFSLAHGYVAARIAKDALKKLEDAEENEPLSQPGKGPVVLGNVEDDCHPLGRQLVTIFLRANDWQVYDLGIDVEAQEFVDEAVRVGAKVIGVSAMIFTTAENIVKVRSEIDKRGLKGKIQMAVGGAVFRLRPELVEQVGGDGTAIDALDTPDLFDRLWERAIQAEEEQNE